MENIIGSFGQSLGFGSEIQITNFYLNESNNTIEVTRRQKSNVFFGNGKSAPDKIWKDIYGVNENGTIVFLEEKIGKHIPAQFVEEKIEF